MRRALAILALVGATAHADGPRTTAIGFDHAIHDRDVVVAGGESLACVKCHVEQRGRLVGKPDHAVCFGACHGAAPIAPHHGQAYVLDLEDRAKSDPLHLGPDRKKLCTNCHAEAALVAPYTGKLAVPYPPYKLDADFNLAVGHKQHRAVACTQCHTFGARPAPHQRCAGCHDGAPGKGAAMRECSACHPPASGRPQPPELAAVHDTVTATFSHVKHAERSAAGRDCVTCHAAIPKTDESELPRPTIRDCAGCHDGKTAFAVTVACTRCHDRPPEAFKVERPTKQFIHGGVHREALAKHACADCHPHGPRGEVIVTGHAVCAECHADDFGARKPKTCGACHNATEPWRPLVADRPLPDETEFGASLDHRKHPGPCASCHVLRTVATQLRTPRGHVSCSPAGCHAITGGPAPHLTSCDGCHQLGLAVARETKRAADAWSVRIAFDHVPHRTSDCVACHVDLAAASVVELPAPPKATCAPCHDGKAAFKLTGTTCTRCHVGAKPR